MAWHCSKFPFCLMCSSEPFFGLLMDGCESEKRERERELGDYGLVRLRKEEARQDFPNFVRLETGEAVGIFLLINTQDHGPWSMVHGAFF